MTYSKNLAFEATVKINKEKDHNTVYTPRYTHWLKNKCFLKKKTNVSNYRQNKNVSVLFI